MICPSCKENQTSVVKSRPLIREDSIKRTRYCICGFTFVTFEIPENKIKKKDTKQRKQRLDTTWKNYRIYLYGKYRIVECSSILIKYIKKHTDEFEKLYEKYRKKPSKQLNKRVNEKLYLMLHTSYAFDSGLGVNKIGSKSSYNTDLGDENFLKLLYNEVEELPPEERNDSYKTLMKMKSREKQELANLGEKNKLVRNIKFPNKKDTVRKILNNELYWKEREKLFKKNSEERNNNSIFRKEVEEFNSCIMKIKEPQYNLDYFQTYEPGFKHHWEEHWGLFLKVR